MSHVMSHVSALNPKTCAGGLEGVSSFEVPVGVAQAVLPRSERLPALPLNASLAPAGSGIASSLASFSSADGGAASLGPEVPPVSMMGVMPSDMEYEPVFQSRGAATSHPEASRGIPNPLLQQQQQPGQPAVMHLSGASPIAAQQRSGSSTVASPAAAITPLQHRVSSTGAFFLTQGAIHVASCTSCNACLGVQTQSFEEIVAALESMLPVRRSEGPISSWEELLCSKCSSDKVRLSN